MVTEELQHRLGADLHSDGVRRRQVRDLEVELVEVYPRQFPCESFRS